MRERSCADQLRSAGSDPYALLPRVGPIDVALGHSLINLSEPWPGKARAYNRWYEDEHYFNNGLFLPWLFSGRRFVATRELKALRPDCGPLAIAGASGSYLGLYWIARDRLEDNLVWDESVHARIGDEGGLFTQRDLVYVGFHDRVSTIYRDDSVPRDVFSLIDPPGGVVLEVIEAPTPGSRAALLDWLKAEHVPSMIARSGATLALIFTPAEPTARIGPALTALADGVVNGGRRVVVTWFLDSDPRESPGWIAEEPLLMRDSGLASVSMVAPFIPSVMGTNLFDEDL